MNERVPRTRLRALLGGLLWVPRRPIEPPRMLASRRAPLIALVLIMAFSFGARVYDIEQPCYGPCTTRLSQLIFDEQYYVNAARSIAGIPQTLGSPYATVSARGYRVRVLSPPSGDDPNAGHPQLAKVLIAATIKLFGDDPWGWRLGSVLFSLIAMGAMYALVTGAGGSPWLAVGTVAVMALDNLMLVQGRIAMLDIYALAMMLVAGALYVRGHPLVAGAALGIGACMKEVAFYLIVALVLFEAARLAQSRWGRAARQASKQRTAVAIRELFGLLLCTFTTFFALLWVLDVLVPASAGSTIYAGNPFAHFGHIVNTAMSLTTRTDGAPLLKRAPALPQPAGTSILSTPLQWLIDQKPLVYATKVIVRIPARHTVSLGNPPGGTSLRTDVLFRGEINPFIIFLAIPALILAVGQAWRARDRVALVGAAWAVGVYAAFLVQSEILHRTSYLYYMLIVLPGIYLMTARLFSWRYVPRLATAVWAGLLVFGFIHLYPIRSFP